MHVQCFIFFVATLVIINIATANVINNGCPKCQPLRCPNTKQCPLGLVEDLCKCCLEGVCARIEGEECYSADLDPPLPVETIKYATCGTNLNCLYQDDDIQQWGFPRATCVCEDTRMICSSENQTYNSMCELQLEAAKKGLASDQLYVQNYGPCIAIPIITEGPKEFIASTNENIMLSCEARGYPIPEITWNFLSKDGETIKKLPNDASNIAVQSRGGPDTFMTTGWVQILKISKTDEGIYTCIATNTLGYTKSSAKVHVRQVHDDI